jgi:hypothetical protein
MPYTRLIPRACRELLSTALAADDLDLQVQDYTDLFFEIGCEHSLTSFTENGWSHGVMEVGGYYFLHVTEVGWTVVASSLEDLEGDEGTSWAVDLETCHAALVAATAKDTLSSDDYLETAFGLGLVEEVCEYGWVESLRATVVYSLGGKYLTSIAEWGEIRSTLDVEGAVEPEHGLTTSAWHGPVDTLADAIGGRIHVGPSTESIRCTEWTDRQLIDRLWLDEPPEVVRINGHPWTAESLLRVQTHFE